MNYSVIPLPTHASTLPPRRRGRPSKARQVAEAFAVFGLFPEVE